MSGVGPERRPPDRPEGLSPRAALPAHDKLYFGTFPSELRPEHVTPAAMAVLRRWVSKILMPFDRCSNAAVLMTTCDIRHDDRPYRCDRGDSASPKRLRPIPMRFMMERYRLHNLRLSSPLSM